MDNESCPTSTIESALQEQLRIEKRNRAILLFITGCIFVPTGIALISLAQYFFYRNDTNLNRSAVIFLIIAFFVCIIGIALIIMSIIWSIKSKLFAHEKDRKIELIVPSLKNQFFSPDKNKEFETFSQETRAQREPGAGDEEEDDDDDDDRYASPGRVFRRK